MRDSSQKELLKQAVTLAINDSWHDSHQIVQDIHSSHAYWIHAVLHKIEGDETNSRYWYGRAQQVYESFSDPKQELVFIKDKL